MVKEEAEAGEEVIITPILKDLKIVKGARHCRIIDEDDNTVFRTTNQRDAEAYLRLVEENRRLHRLLEARGVAPHRIYLLEQGESPIEVVIVAKASPDTVVVRHLQDGREEIVDLDDVRDLPEADYFSGSEIPRETVHVSVRLDTESEMVMIAAHRSGDSARDLRETWRRASFEPDREDMIAASASGDSAVIFTHELEVED
jgi:hypothetical protein